MSEHWKRARVDMEEGGAVELVWQPGARQAWLDVLTKRERRLSTTSMTPDALRELGKRCRQLADAMLRGAGS